jgi:hypothetical protein
MAACDMAREDDLSKMMLSYPLRGTKFKNKIAKRTKFKNEIAERDG